MNPNAIPSILEQIPLSASDRLLRDWGFDLLKEYLLIAQNLPPKCARVLELATGSGRMCTILACLFTSVVTGDRTLSDHSRVIERVPAQFLSRIQFLQLEMEQLPFATGEFPAAVCMNTLHETEHPSACLQELIRITDTGGTLIVGDFNTTGFDAMQKIHQAVYHNNHETGSITSGEIENILTTSFHTVRTVHTPLNISFVAAHKRRSALL